MALVACVSVKICVSTTQFESSHQFTLVCAVSDFITVPGCHYNSCSKSQFCSDWITLSRAVFLLSRHSLSLLYTDLCLLQLWSDMFFVWSPSLTAALEFECECFLSSHHHSKFSFTHAEQIYFTHTQIKKTTCYTTWLLSISWSRHKLDSFDYLLVVWLSSILLLSSKGKFHADSLASCL